MLIRAIVNEKPLWSCRVRLTQPVCEAGQPNQELGLWKFSIEGLSDDLP